MLQTMYAAPGIGLAAPQVGVPKRAFVADLSGEGERAPIYVINPEIIARSETTNVAEEGCLSLPKHFGDRLARAVVAGRGARDVGVARTVWPTACWRAACSTRSTI